ncbi:Uncharacterised protein [uncultured archaeon]|nr:Uncharacterised protein [uncultured archaeon]
MELHLWECYRCDKISVNLTDSFKNIIKEKIMNRIYEVAKEIKVTPTRLYEYFIYQSSVVPLDTLMSICKLFDIPAITMEKEITLYKQMYVPLKNSIRKPKLPLKMSPYFTSIVANLFFDGSVPKDGKGTYYNQKSEEIMQNFIMRVKDVFGDVNYTLRLDHRGVLKCRLPRLIGEMCMHIYDVNSFGTFDSTVPSNVFKLSNEHKLAFVLSAIVDEGSITYDGEIMFGVSNKDLAEGVRKLCTELQLNANEVKRISGSNHYYFYLKSQDMFYEIFTQAKKSYPLFSLGYKEERLWHALRLRKVPFGYTQEFANKRREEIIKKLSQEPLSINQLSQSLFIRPRSLRRHVSFLLNQKRIVKLKKNKNNPIYFCPTA